MTVTAADITSLAAESMFGRPLVTNVARAVLVEAMIATVLRPAWTWCSADYEAFDFRHAGGCRLEVKQTSAKQSWPQSRASRPQWDIRPRTGRWEGPVWIAEHGRNADIYVLAHHPIFEGEVDHRDPSQWIFYCILATSLSAADSIGLSSLNRLKPLRSNLEGLSLSVTTLLGDLVDPCRVNPSLTISADLGEAGRLRSTCEPA